ncbi:MAG: adenylate/guanylate cyclase domain-containing protein, partial [Pseudomonadota bacterium]
AEAPLPQTLSRFYWFSRVDDRAETLIAQNKHVAAALEEHKRRGVELAVRARTIAMTTIGLMVLALTPWPEVLYYEVLVGLFILIGLAQRRYARVGTSRAELALLFCDLLLMTIIAAVPNPFSAQDFPVLFQFQFDIHKYFFVILATATLAYSWRTIFAVGTWTTVLWVIASISAWYVSVPDPGMAEALDRIYSGSRVMIDFLDPTRMVWDQRIQEAVVFLMCAIILGISVRRFNNLLLAQATAERERTNLARYFSPNVVEQLSGNDEPLKQVRTQNIAVLFVDIVGFTTFAAQRNPEEVIKVLRDFHARMENEVFRHNGTLDKFLGDGLMATFGTPVTSDRDAANALACARSMIDTMTVWNAERAEAGEPEIRASVGVHYGPAVLGDIGGEQRLEYAVIGNTVNVASRLEALTRPLGARLLASADLIDRARSECGSEEGILEALDPLEPQSVRGVPDPVPVWALR